MKRILPAILVVGGVAMIALAAHSALAPPAPLYELRASPAPAEALPEEVAKELGAANLERLEWRAAGVERPVASGLATRDAFGRLSPIEWRNGAPEPAFFFDIGAADESKVLKAIRDHVPEDAVVLSWWDMSRRIRGLARRLAPLDDPLARGLAIPAAQRSSAARVGDERRKLWGAGVPSRDAETFTKFIDALLQDEERGAAALRELAGGKNAYVAVHLSDLSKAAAARPGAVEIAYRDFPGAGHAHGVMKAVRQWVQDEKIEGGYAIEPVGESVRLHYLPRKSDADVLLARLLPFSTSNPLRLDRLRLVYQHKGYWIYELLPAKS